MREEIRYIYQLKKLSRETDGLLPRVKRSVISHKGINRVKTKPSTLTT